MNQPPPKPFSLNQHFELHKKQKWIPSFTPPEWESLASQIGRTVDECKHEWQAHVEPTYGFTNEQDNVLVNNLKGLDGHFDWHGFAARHFGTDGPSGFACRLRWKYERSKLRSKANAAYKKNRQKSVRKAVKKHYDKNRATTRNIVGVWNSRHSSPLPTALAVGTVAIVPDDNIATALALVPTEALQDQPPTVNALLQFMSQMHATENEAQKGRDLQIHEIDAREIKIKQIERLKSRDEDARELAQGCLKQMEQLVKLATPKKSAPMVLVSFALHSFAHSALFLTFVFTFHSPIRK